MNSTDLNATSPVATDASRVEQLLSQSLSDDPVARTSAMRELLLTGEPIPRFLRLHHQRGVFELDDMVAAFTEIGATNPSTFTGLASAFRIRSRRTLFAALRVCEYLPQIPPVVQDGIADLITNSEMCEFERSRALHLVREKRLSNRRVLDALATALEDQIAGIQDNSLMALMRVSVDTPEIRAALAKHLHPTDFLCNGALYTLRKLRCADLAVLQAVNRVATAEFTYRERRPDEDPDYYDHWRSVCRNYFESNVPLAKEVLQDLTAALLDSHSLSISADRVAPLPEALDAKLKRLFATELEKDVWHWLRVFLRVADTGAYARAAREIGMTHAASVRKNVGKFEKAIGVTVLRPKRPTGIVLTPEGQLLHAWAKAVFALQDR